MMDEILVSPDTPDDLEGFKEHLARPLLIDAECLEFRRTQPAAQPHIEASAGQIVEHCRLLGDKQRVPERQDIDHAAEADALRRSRRGGDQQIGRGGPAPSVGDDAQKTRSDRCRYVPRARLLRAGAGTFLYVSNFRAVWSSTRLRV